MFVVLSDQTPPNIYLHELMNKTVYPREDFALYLKAVDVGSGIMPDGFDITVDGIPGKAEFFPKDGRLEIFEPEILYEPGKHTVLASVRDFAGNWSSTVRYDYEIQTPPVPEEKKKPTTDPLLIETSKEKKSTKESKPKQSSPKVQKVAKPITVAPKAKDKKSTSR